MTSIRRSRLAAGLVVVVTSIAAPSAPASAGTAASSTSAPMVASSTSWTTPDRGWVLGFRACGSDQCARLIATNDGGETWTTRNAPPVKLPARDIQVRVVLVPRPARSPEDAGNTIAYATDGRRVFVTHDGAQTWTNVRLAGVSGRASVGDLVATDQRVYAIVGDGSVDDGRARLFAARTAAERWRARDGVETAGNGVNVDGGWDITTDGRAVAVALGRIFLDNGYWTSPHGRAFTPHGRPCTDDQVPDLGAVRGTDVAALCSYNPGTGHMFKDLKTSTDGGPFDPAGSAPDLGITQEYASPAENEHVITAIGGASILYYGADDEWDDPLFLPDALPWADLQFVNQDSGFVVWGGPRYGMAEVYHSSNGGRSWERLDLS